MSGGRPDGVRRANEPIGSAVSIKRSREPGGTGLAGAESNGGILAGGVAAEVKSKLSVVDVVSESVQLKKAGTTYKGLCPFHGEKTPSFVVTPARESWKCFGCGLGGDIFSFVMQRDSVPFPEALRQLASKAGVEIDERTKREDARRARLRDVLETGIAFYHQVLVGSKVGTTALVYLRGRGFTDETIEKAQLGWAPEGWETLSRRLVEKRDIRAEELVEVGLAAPGRSGRGVGVYDKFRGRVLFPIRDQNGHAVGLGGRILGSEGQDGRDTGPKYLNTPATPLFDKSRTLYLIDKAKGPIRKSGQAVIVEGYTDALMAHQAGFDNVVASLGTALTPGQVALLTRYTKRIALAYDVDAAGEKAGALGARALEALIGQLAVSDSGVELDEVRVVRLPEGKDPDEVVRETPDRWREEVRAAQPIVDYLIDSTARGHDLRTASGKARFVDALIPTIRAVPNPIMRDAYLQQIRQASGVEERVLLEVLHRRDGLIGGAQSGGGAGSVVGRITAESVIGSADALPVTEILRAISPHEAELLRLVLLVPAAQLRVVESVGPDLLPSQVARELFRALVIARAPNDEGVHPPFDSAAFIAGLDDETAALARALYAKGGPDSRDLPDHRLTYEIERLVIDLEENQLRDRAEFNEANTAEAERDGDRAAIERLATERRSINEQRLSLDRRREQTRLLTRRTPAATATS